jgi:HEAT repeats/Squalene-hopene cyclase C-terminal domain
MNYPRPAWIAGCVTLACALAASNPYSVSGVVKKTGELRSETISLGRLRAGSRYSLLFAIPSLASLGPDSRIHIDLSQGSAHLLRKTLHLGDPDLYGMFHVPSDGSAELKVDVAGMPGGARYLLEVNHWRGPNSLNQEPNHEWQQANPIVLGETIFASEDDTPYIPAGDAKAPAGAPHWFRFHFDGPRPKLVFFQMDLMERDNIPVDISVYQAKDGKAAPYYEGEDPVAVPHEVQALPGNKFTARVLRDAGDYFIRVTANHPEFKLRTRVYDPPPYTDPHQAVQTAVDFILAAGDSWHANTPRRGGSLDRVANVHQETSLCVACHPTHFSQRAQLYALQNGYALHDRQQLQFLSERFYNNPRPFYGFEKEGAVWARVISAPANVLSRMAVLLDLFEKQVSGEHRASYFDGVAKYLQIYYKDRDKLPNDETNGNQPLVSTYEVAWYSWRVTHDERIARLIDQDEIKNMIDLCYQTLALADIDRAKYAEKIQRNAERILSLQRPSGQWAMRFEPAQPEAEFQTGHALWALQAAGIPKDNPQVAKAIQYLLNRQQPFGGWMDPLQSYENFRTPFRETQMSVLALSSYFPVSEHKKGWDSRAPAQLARDPAELLRDLDKVWDQPTPALLAQIKEAAESNDALVRQQAAETLGRIASPSTLDWLVRLLGDPSKLVQRTAAWAIRQTYSRHDDISPDALVSALGSKNDRVRWGATRVFATHFAGLARRSEFARPLIALTGDPVPTIRMQALKGLWQFWFWSPDEEVKSQIEDAFLSAMAKPQHPWVERNLREGIYNLADENIRYLYNNWVPLLAQQQDRTRAIEGRLAVEARLAGKFSAVLENGSDLQRRVLLTGLTEYHLRRADVYDMSADHSRPAPAVYNRIGNDTEQIVFFGKSNDRFARALRPLIDSPDPELSKLAVKASLLCRKVSFPGVNETAGPAGSDSVQLISAVLAKPAPADVDKALRPPSRTATAGATAKSKSSKSAGGNYTRPDQTYFRAYVEPILTKRGRDGYACVHCHATHTLFNGTYETALNVVDQGDPENSLILRKPTSSSESEGVLGSKVLPHGGGIRWEKDSPEYQTILRWIKGAKQ